MTIALTRDELLSVDIIQRLREATVAILDTHPDVVTLTGRDSGNVIPASSRTVFATPAIVYAFIVGTELNADGDTREVTIQLTAYAEDDDDATANALIAVAERVYDGPTFEALAVPLDAFVTRRVRRDVGGNDALARADLDVTLRVYQPVLTQ